MKNRETEDIKGFLPLTYHTSKLIQQSPQPPVVAVMLDAENYQNNKTNPQQFYKPISKILRFQ